MYVSLLRTTLLSSSCALHTLSVAVPSQSAAPTRRVGTKRKLNCGSAMSGAGSPAFTDSPGIFHQTPVRPSPYSRTPCVPPTHPTHPRAMFLYPRSFPSPACIITRRTQGVRRAVYVVDRSRPPAYLGLLRYSCVYTSSFSFVLAVFVFGWLVPSALSVIRWNRVHD
jgi:hypothetical protein